MERKFLPCCYFPTTVLFIDDDPTLLRSIRLNFGQQLVCKLYEDPRKALKFLKEDYQYTSFTDRCLLRPEESDRDHRSLDIDIQSIHHEIYNTLRFSQIAVIVVDYTMPGLDGITFCKELSTSPIKKILLTGDAGEKEAIQAFNQGIIHRFIRKNEAHFLDQVKTAITELQYIYFQELSEIFINSLIKDPEASPSCLDDPVFIELFQKILRDHAFIEYYLVDTYGSFLFFDAQSQPSWLIVKNEEEMEGYYETAELSNDVPESILEPLRKREKIVYFHTNGDYLIHASQWKPYMHPAHKLIGKNFYYYSLVTSPTPYDIRANKITSYQVYLNSIK